MELNVDTLLTRTDVGLLNESVRGLRLDVGEKANMSTHFGVGGRTVDRWFTTAAERRNMVPLRAAGGTLRTLDEAIARRAIGAQLLAGGSVTQTTAGVGRTEVWRVRMGSTTDAIRYLVDLSRGGIDPYLSKVWHRAEMTQDGRDWILKIEYRRDAAAGGS